MEDLVILSSPLLLTLLAVSLLLSIFNAAKKSKTIAIALISLLITIGTVTYALILGASLEGALIVMLVFALINIPGFKQDKKEDIEEQVLGTDVYEGIERYADENKEEEETDGV